MCIGNAFELCFFIVKALLIFLPSVVQTLDRAFYQTNHYPTDKYSGKQLRYTLGLKVIMEIIKLFPQPWPFFFTVLGVFRMYSRLKTHAVPDPTQKGLLNFSGIRDTQGFSRYGPRVLGSISAAVSVLPEKRRLDT